MLNLLRGEYYQAKKSLTIKLTFVIILVASIIFGIKFSDASYSETFRANDRLDLLCGGGSICGTMGDSAMVLLLAGLFAGWMISGSFENRIIQESISYGRKRSSVYLAKMLMYCTVVTAFCLIYWCVSALPIFIKYGLGTNEICGNLSRPSYIIGMVATGSLAYISLFVICGIIAFFTRKTGVTMGICIVGILAGGNLMSAILPAKVLKIINYTPFGLYKSVLKLDITWSEMGITAMISLIWIVLICVSGYLKFQKTELK